MSIEVTVSKMLPKEISKLSNNIVKDHLKKNGIDIACPTCGRTINAKLGNSKCRYCKTTFALKM